MFKKTASVIAATLGIASYANAFDLVVINNGASRIIQPHIIEETNTVVCDKPILEVRLDEGRVFNVQGYKDLRDDERSKPVIPFVEKSFFVKSGDRQIKVIPPPLIKVNYGDIEYHICTDNDDEADSLRKLEGKINDFWKGIKNVERFYGGNLVDRVILTDLSHRNAYSLKKGSDIFIYPDFLDTSSRNLISAGEHEAFHKVVDIEGYASNNEIIENFFKLRLREYWENNSGTDFFSFIDEKNYIPGALGGHSDKNIDEFSVSIIHTLMYPDYFLKNTPKRDLDSYLDVLDVFFNNSSEHGKSMFYPFEYAMIK